MERRTARCLFIHSSALCFSKTYMSCWLRPLPRFGPCGRLASSPRPSPARAPIRRPRRLVSGVVAPLADRDLFFQNLHVLLAGAPAEVWSLREVGQLAASKPS